MTQPEESVSEESAWNPGLSSDIPSALWPGVTLFRQENATVSHAEASELHDLTGIGVLELISLRAERLVIHALLVKVTADLTVADGPKYAELGINLRSMVERIYTQHIVQQVPAIESALTAEREKALKLVTTHLSDTFQPAPVAESNNKEQRSLWARLFNKADASPAVSRASDNPELSAVQRWKQALLSTDNGLQSICLEALIKTVDSIVGHRGRMLPDLDLVARIVVNRVMNKHGSAVVEQMIDEQWQQAIATEGYRALPAQEKPLIMNVKGASASGKSTIRPRQRQLAQKLGVAWEDFALISPDYWRKYLLDYDSLGDDHKYGAMLTGRELEIIDKKLDSYMARKAANGTLSHLLIDRFRFDSFIVDIDRPSDSRLLSRFGDSVYLFFMVTHPSETVVRAWHRGQSTGRYKAVDDLLFHNVEAFTGMPSLFLSWVTSKDKRVHFEFLDNDVPEGELPRTAAFGYNQVLIVLDITLLLNIDRYRKVNIAAQAKEEIFQSADLNAAANLGFVEQCAKTVEHIVFADPDTAAQYAVVHGGKLVWWNDAYIAANANVEGLIAMLESLGYSAQPCASDLQQVSPVSDITEGRRALVGHFGSL